MTGGAFNVRDPEIEQMMRAIANSLGTAIQGTGFTFALFLVEVNVTNGALFYISGAGTGFDAAGDRTVVPAAEAIGSSQRLASVGGRSHRCSRTVARWRGENTAGKVPSIPSCSPLG